MLMIQQLVETLRISRDGGMNYVILALGVLLPKQYKDSAVSKTQPSVQSKITFR